MKNKNTYKKLESLKSDSQRIKVDSAFLFSFSEYDETVIVFADNKTLRHKRGFDDAEVLFCDVDFVGSINPVHWRELSITESEKLKGEMEASQAQDELENKQYHKALSFAEKW